eukprot:6176272-Pleurochrysis_carterae.AAC.3
MVHAIGIRETCLARAGVGTALPQRLAQRTGGGQGRRTRRGDGRVRAKARANGGSREGQQKRGCLLGTAWPPCWLVQEGHPTDSQGRSSTRSRLRRRLRGLPQGLPLPSCARASSWKAGWSSHQEH